MRRNDTIELIKRVHKVKVTVSTIVNFYIHWLWLLMEAPRKIESVKILAFFGINEIFKIRMFYPKEQEKRIANGFRNRLQV